MVSTRRKQPARGAAAATADAPQEGHPSEKEEAAVPPDGAADAEQEPSASLSPAAAVQVGRAFGRSRIPCMHKLAHASVAFLRDSLLSAASCIPVCDRIGTSVFALHTRQKGSNGTQSP